jgi:hypothetical protein
VFRFTIRDALWLVVVAMGVGWFCQASSLRIGNHIRDDKMRMMHETMERMSERIKELEGKK